MMELTNRPRALILHRMSLNRKPHEQVWYQDLKCKLEAKGYHVEIPVMPDKFFGTESLEDLAVRFRYLSACYSLRTGIDIIIGHSIGGGLALYLGQYCSVRKLILVAPFVPPGLQYQEIMENISTLDLYYEQKDPSIPLNMIHKLIRNLSQKLIVYEESSEDHLNHIDTEKIIKNL